MIVAMAGPADAAAVGGKAAALMRLAGQGFRVPPFFTLPPAAFGPEGLGDEARAEMLLALQALGPGPYAARSSAAQEDGESHSHAGQFLSVLELPAEELPSACERVFLSGQAASVSEYRASRGLDGAAEGAAVLVQRMVDARAAGVVFTADPVSGRRDRIVVSAVAGLGDRLVGGEEDGQTYLLTLDGAVLEAPLQDAVLDADDLEKLRELACAVEAAAGAAQDIEWAFEGDTLYLLQARPVTTMLRPAPAPDTTVSVFDNSNIVESYPGLVSPLTYSFAQYVYARVYRAFVALIGVDGRTIAAHAVFDNMLARIDGRVYYNLVNWYRALALLPGFSINRAHMETMMGVSEPLPEEISSSIGPPPAKGWRLVREWLRLGALSFGLLWRAIRLPATMRAFYARLDAALARPAETLDAMPLTDLAAEYRRLEADLLDRWDAPLINDFLCMIGFGASRKLLEKWGGPAGLEVHNDMMIGQGDIVSAEPAQRIRRIGAMLDGRDTLRGELAAGDGSGLDAYPELKAEIASYLERFADRCAEELKLESVTLDRDPAPLYRAVAGASVQHGGEKASSKGLASLFQGKPVKRRVAGLLMRWAKARVRDRENLRFERTRIFGRARRLFRAVGAQFSAHGVLDDPEDIFLLTVDEVLGAIEGFGVSADLRGLADLRRVEMSRAKARPDPGERVVVSGAAVVGLESAAPARVQQEEGSERAGTGCSAGEVRATARVITDPRGQSLAKGEVLVASHTDPGWIALFSNASAIVVERGSLLSHSAIVARELGIPCVVGLKGATNWIADGETIEVNGGTGRVRRLE